MRPTEQLHHEGQSLWPDNITRDLQIGRASCRERV